jgi:hypothetical protein
MRRLLSAADGSYEPMGSRLLPNEHGRSWGGWPLPVTFPRQPTAAAAKALPAKGSTMGRRRWPRPTFSRRLERCALVLSLSSAPRDEDVTLHNEGRARCPASGVQWSPARNPILGETAPIRLHGFVTVGGWTQSLARFTRATIVQIADEANRSESV